ncbi:MAG: hypothetical protein Q9227_005225 [Pyrenula ochraceoflavens]
MPGIAIEPDAPPFPSDIPTAPLLRLSLSKLYSHDPEELSRFTSACEELGFFYLDLTDSEPTLLSTADTLFTVGESLFSLPLSQKNQYDFSAQNSYFGYKAQGAAIVDRQGNLDRNEFYNVSKDDLFSISSPPLPAPSILTENSNPIKNFMQTSHSIVTFLLSLLNTHLRLPPNTLQNLHRLHSPSGDQVRFIKSPPQPASDRRTSLGEHTDFGSITILFNRLGGLQVLLPPGKSSSSSSRWLYVQPLPGHAIVNLGDALATFTNGLLRSNIHRVVSPPGQQAECTRYSLVYFARPEDRVEMRALGGSEVIPPEGRGEGGEKKGEVVTAKEWIIRRALGHRVKLGKGVGDWEEGLGTERLSRREETA